MVRYGKTYASSDSHMGEKFKTFQENLHMIRTHNESGSGIKLAVNKYSDMTEEEFQQRLMLSVPEKKRL